MKTEEIIARIETLYAKGVPSDESRLSPRHIYSKMKSVRMLLLSQQIKKRQVINDNNYTIFPCVELIKVPAHECSCLGQLGCDIYRTKYALPTILTDLNRHLIQFVMSITSGMKIEEITRESALYLKGNKYTGAKPKYLLENGFLYFPVVKSPGIVKIKLLLEDPIEALNFPSFCEDCSDCVNCDSILEIEFPIDGNLIEPLISLCVQELIVVFNQMRQDNLNDSTDNGKRQEE